MFRIIPNLAGDSIRIKSGFPVSRLIIGGNRSPELVEGTAGGKNPP
jgi:hypothetical protein